MPFAISPTHMAEDFKGPLSIYEKIDVFTARVRGWHIQPALDMRDRGIPHRGFAQLLIISSYFEMIGKYRDGFIGEYKSFQYFKKGFLYTFPDLSPDEKELMEVFYKSIRNGLYHVGMTKPNVLIYDGILGSFGFNEQLRQILISPDRFIEDISIRFDVFAEELRNPDNQELQSNFEQRFDNDNSL